MLKFDLSAIILFLSSLRYDLTCKGRASSLDIATVIGCWLTEENLLASLILCLRRVFVMPYYAAAGIVEFIGRILSTIKILCIVNVRIGIV